MPNQMTFEEELRFYHSVGRLIDRWGYVDSLTTQLCNDVIEKLGYPAPKRVPWGLAERLQFVGECFASDHRFHPIQSDLADILKAVKTIDETRSYLVHGCKTEFFRERMSVQLTKLDRTPAKDGYVQFSREVSFDELGNLADGASLIVGGLVKVGHLISEFSRLKL
jgi:hypothetical protein